MYVQLQGERESKITKSERTNFMDDLWSIMEFLKKVVQTMWKQRMGLNLILETTDLEVDVQ